jgi:NADH-quinone oxidoreductase subunit M
MASLGLPGLGNFVAEFLVLLGTYSVDVALTALATVGLVAATVYSLWIIQQAFHGQPRRQWKVMDLNRRELLVLGAMVVMLVWLGFYPRPVLRTTNQFVAQTESYVIR